MVKAPTPQFVAGIVLERVTKLETAVPPSRLATSAGVATEIVTVAMAVIVAMAVLVLLVEARVTVMDSREVSMETATVDISVVVVMVDISGVTEFVRWRGTTMPIVHYKDCLVH